MVEDRLMDVPLEISFRNMDHSDAVELRVRERAVKLEQYFGRINSCRVVVEAPERSKRKGQLFHVRLDITVPGKELVVNRHPGAKHAHEDVYVAIRDAFRAAERQLEDHSRRVSGRVKAHEAPPHGKVLRLFPDQDYGFIALSDGQEVYFHRNAVVNDGFDTLEVGAEVRLAIAEKEGVEGPQASTVHPVGKQHPT
jgi:ribosomal subunit interface protein